MREDLRLTSLEMSDHRPIWASFWTDVDDDEDEYGMLFGGGGVTGMLRGEVPEHSDVLPNVDGNSVVYRTETGSKYHQDGCRFLSKSKIPIPLYSAERRGLEPCRVCVDSAGE